jgi:hypothetical protein
MDIDHFRVSAMPAVPVPAIDGDLRLPVIDYLFNFQHFFHPLMG